MKRFWATAAAHWPLSLPRRRLEAAVGAENVVGLVKAGVLHVGALVAGEAVSCRECRRNARLVDEDGGLVAVCEGGTECPCETFGEAAERVFVEPVAFARVVGGAFGLEGSAAGAGIVVPLGRRAMGAEVVAFHFVPRPTRAGVNDALYRLVRGGPRVGVVLVPDSRWLRGDEPSELVGVELVWAGLDEVLAIDARGMRGDLRPVLARRYFEGFALEVPFDGLALGERGATWRGRPLALGKGAIPLPLRLLRLLATRPGELVSSREIGRVLYPDDHTRGGNLARGMNPEDMRDKVRSVVGVLRDAFRAAGEDGELVKNRRGEGYLLALGPERVRVE